MKKRLLPVAGITLLGVATVAGVSIAQDPGSGTDYEEAAELYGDRPPCPEGSVELTVPWEDAAASAQRIADADPAVESNSVPRVDLLWVAPNDPAGFVDSDDELKMGLVLVACVEAQPGDLRLVDADAIILTNREPRGA